MVDSIIHLYLGKVHSSATGPLVSFPDPTPDRGKGLVAFDFLGLVRVFQFEDLNCHSDFEKQVWAGRVRTREGLMLPLCCGWLRPRA